MYVLLAHDVGHGELRTDGMLGYRCAETEGYVVLPKSAMQRAEQISAHAPSQLRVQFLEPVQVQACMAVSGWARQVSCYIDYHRIGVIGAGHRSTPIIHLAPGEYTFAMQCGNGQGAHTCWLFKHDKKPPKSRVALLTHCYYPPDQVDHMCRYLFASAARLGLHVRCIGVGRPWEQFVTKVFAMREAVDQVGEHYDVIACIDANDVLVLQPEEKIAEVAGDKAIIGAEPCGWPVRDPDWTTRFVSAVSPIRFPNSGVIAGPRRGMQRMYAYAQRTLEHLRDGIAKASALRYRHWWRDDQHVWQQTVLDYRELIRVDHRCRFAACLGCVGGNLAANPIVGLREGQVVARSGESPCFLHLCGQSKSHIALWYRALYG